MWVMSGSSYRGLWKVLQQIFLGYAGVKGSKTDTKSQAYCFIRFMLMDTEIIKINETRNLQQNSHISCSISNVLN